MASLTQELAQLASGMTIEAIPDEARRIAKTGFADCAGVMIAGAGEPAVGIVARQLGGPISNNGGGESASLLPRGGKRAVENAALVNAVAAHVLDYDDVALDGHPSAVLAPAILAQAEAQTETLGATGAEMVAAYVAGYEVWAELLARVPGPMHAKGWHPTAVLGAVAAAAACGRLRRLDAQRMAHALALAASLAAGLVANFGTMTKSFQVGRAAQSGLTAAKLAAAGFTAAPDAFEHAAGFLAAFAKGENAERPRPLDQNRAWQILKQGLNVKRYPLCYATHRAIDAAIELVEQHQVRPGDIAGIDVKTGTTQMLMLRNHRPQTGLEAKFSMEFAMASAAIARRVGLAELSDGFVRRPEVQAMLPSVATRAIEGPGAGDTFAPYDEIGIRLKSGRRIDSGRIEHALGSHAKPMSADQLRAKFEDCVGASFPEADRARAIEGFMALEKIPSVAALNLARG
ncbi:MAG: MmgE/PrpD family protein [Rhodospirillales bacterium]